MDLDEFITASAVSGTSDDNDSCSNGPEPSNSPVLNGHVAPNISRTGENSPEGSSESENSDASVIAKQRGSPDGKGSEGEGRRSRKSSKSSDNNGYVYKPAPIFNKSKRKFTPDECKDGKYWERRIKNNVAAKRSRDMRREKEIEIAEMCKHLEDENAQLKEEILRLEAKAKDLEQKVALKTSKQSK